MQVPLDDVTRFLELNWALHQAITRRVRPLLESQHDLDARAFAVLHQVVRGARYPGEVAERLHMPSDMTSRALDPLVKHGFLERHLDPDDGRRVQLRVTERGLEAHDGAQRTLHHEVASLLEGLDAAARDALLDTLQQLAARAAQPTPEPDQETVNA